MPAGDPIRALVVTDSLIVVGRDVAGRLEVYDRKTGLPRWNKAIPNWVHSAPVIDHDRVIVTFGDNRRGNTRVEPSGAPIVGAGHGGAMALSLSDGQTEWNYLATGAIMPPPRVVGDTVVLTSGGGEIIGLDRRTGRLLWRESAGGIASMAGPVISKDVMYTGLSDPQSIVALDLRHHNILWHRNFGEFARGTGDVSPVIVGGVLYTTFTELISGMGFFSLGAIRLWPAKVWMRLGKRPWRALERQWVAAVSTRDGALLWMRSVGVGYHRELNRSGTPSPVDGGVVFSSFVTNEVYRIGRTGDIVWTRALPGEAAKGNVAVEGDSVAAALADGRVVLLSAKTGAIWEVMPSQGRIAFFTPLICDHDLLYPTEDGRLAAVPIVDHGMKGAPCGASPR
jgi:outer membrane protein assembly factor BamB